MEKSEDVTKKSKGKTNSLYTRSRCPMRIVYHEEFTTLAAARRREAHVKTWSKIKKRKSHSRETSREELNYFSNA